MFFKQMIFLNDFFFCIMRMNEERTAHDIHVYELELIRIIQNAST